MIKPKLMDDQCTLSWSRKSFKGGLLRPEFNEDKAEAEAEDVEVIEAVAVEAGDEAEAVEAEDEAEAVEEADEDEDADADEDEEDDNKNQQL